MIENIISSLPYWVNPYFYRTSAGAEIDLILEFGSGEFWAVEIKVSRTPKLEKGFHIACEDLKVKEKFPVNKDTMILSLSNFIREIRRRMA